MKKIKSALVSLSDKKDLKPLLQILRKNKIRIISSGGTFKVIKKLKFKCLEISNFTGILNKRNNRSHQNDLKLNNFENIDLVIVNFYPFEQTLEHTKNHEKIIENIDIGGPAMVRAAAKNYKDVTVITSPKDYPELINELRINKGSTSLEFKKKWLN